MQVHSNKYVCMCAYVSVCSPERDCCGDGNLKGFFGVAHIPHSACIQCMSRAVVRTAALSIS